MCEGLEKHGFKNKKSKQKKFYISPSYQQKELQTENDDTETVKA